MKLLTSLYLDSARPDTAHTTCIPSMAYGGFRMWKTLLARIRHFALNIRNEATIRRETKKVEAAHLPVFSLVRTYRTAYSL
jgi:hypothetical protein